MLSGLAASQLNIILGSLSQVVSLSIDAYEKEVAKIQSEIERKTSEEALRLLLDNMLSRILEEKPTSVYPLYATISKSLIDVNFNVAIFIVSLTATKQIVAEILSATTGRTNTEAGRFISNYIDIIKKASK